MYEFASSLSIDIVSKGYTMTSWGPYMVRQVRLAMQKRMNVRHVSSSTSGGRPKSQHTFLYTDIFPPMMRVLAYSTAAYFAMHLTWLKLKNEEEKRAQTREMTQLRDEVRTSVA